MTMTPADKAAVAEEFHHLRPLCTAVMKNPSVDNIRELKSALRSCPQKVLQSLQTYIIFPLEAHLRAPQTRSKLQGELVDCLKALLQQTEIDSINTFFRLFTLIFSHLYDKDQKNLLSSINEELKMSLVECACELLRQTSIDVKRQVYEKQNTPWLSQGVYVCVQLQQYEKHRPLRIAAIDCLMLLNQTHEDVRISSSEIQEKVADMFATMFPGILAGLTATIMGDPKQGHTVVVKAVEAWWRLLVLVLQDNSTSEDAPHPRNLLELVHQAVIRYKKAEPDIPTEDTETVLQSSHCKTSKWQRAAASKVVRPIVVVTESLQKHGHPLVRKKLAVACQQLLEKNARILSGAVPALIDALVVLSEDSEPSVYKFAAASVVNFSTRLSSSGESLMSLVEKRLHSIIESLPNSLHCRHDEEQQLSSLHLLAGYLRLLGPSLKQLTKSPLHCQKLFNALLDAAELDTSGISLLEDCGLRDVDMPVTRIPWRSLRHLFAVPVIAALENVCRILGSSGHLDSMADILLQLVPERTEAVLILNMVTAGIARQEESNWPVVKSILDVYLEPSVWYRPLFVSDTVSLGAAQANLTLACLLVEGLGIMYKKISQDCVPQFLLRSLYVTLERAGSTHKVLSDAGMEAARSMANGDISTLIWDNADYLSFHTAYNLRLPERQQGALSVLGVLLRHSRLENLPQLRDMVGMVISQTGYQDDEQSLAQLQVMRAFVGCVRGWLEKRQTSIPQSDSFSFPKKNSSIDLVSEILEYRQNKNKQPEEESENLNLDEIGKRFAAETADTEEEEDYTTDQQDDNRLPAHVAAVQEVLHRCIHTLPRSRATQHQVVSLEALTDGVHCLKAHSTILLRAAHKIWEAMSPLFGHSEPKILARCFTLLCALTSSSGEFLRSRCIKLAFPPLFEFLRRSAPDSMLQDSASAYRFTQAYKLQLSLLEGLGPLAAALSLSGYPLRELVTVCAPYLSSQQPQPLQEACVELYKTLCDVDADIVWFRLVCVWSPSSELVPSSRNLGLEIHKLPRNCAEDSEYKKNVSCILQYLEQPK